ncbi:putative elongator complex protein 2 [Morus notabilis]|uniref:Elongator complex protein 2 n=1 Tax=Morus notabilis TaxID=981085 RepID=W9RP85_9ROSA|nr:putative elongator complex protein 2 [Morus notabilis]
MDPGSKSIEVEHVREWKTQIQKDCSESLLWMMGGETCLWSSDRRQSNGRSCEAQSATVAEVWLWQVGSWKAVGRLQSHSLTVTQMEFSHDDKLLLTVSRDRQFSIFAIKGTGTEEISHELIARKEAHKRILWACSWNPHGYEFATGSRDKTVKIWGVENQSSVNLLLMLPPFKTSVTALSWIGLGNNRSNGLLAVGMENGLIELWNLFINRINDRSTKAPPATAALFARLDPLMCHVSAVNRLAWRIPEKSDKECSNLQLASCGADHCVRVFDVKTLPDKMGRGMKQRASVRKRQ